MNVAIIWTLIAAVGMAGAMRNVMRRHQNVVALKARGINGPAILTAQAFRNSEILRLFQATLGLIIGLVTIAFFTSEYYQALAAARAAGAIAEPTIVIIYRNVLQYGFLAWQVSLVVNIWYFGMIGDRAEALRRRLHPEAD